VRNLRFLGVKYGRIETLIETEKATDNPEDLDQINCDYYIPLDTVNLATLRRWTLKDLLESMRCCLTCIRLQATCPEGGFSEIGDPLRELSERECNAWKQKP